MNHKSPGKTTLSFPNFSYCLISTKHIDWFSTQNWPQSYTECLLNVIDSFTFTNSHHWSRHNFLFLNPLIPSWTDSFVHRFTNNNYTINNLQGRKTKNKGLNTTKICSWPCYCSVNRLNHFSQEGSVFTHRGSSAYLFRISPFLEISAHLLLFHLICHYIKAGDQEPQPYDLSPQLTKTTSDIFQTMSASKS